VHLHHLPAGNAAQAQRIVLPKQLLACRWQPSHVIKALDVLRPDFLFVKEPPVDCIGAVDMISHSSQAPDLKLLYPPGRVPWRPPPPCRRGCCPSCRGAERLQGCSSRCLPSPQRPFAQCVEYAPVGTSRAEHGRPGWKPVGKRRPCRLSSPSLQQRFRLEKPVH